MNEDDTFDALRRPGVREMFTLYMTNLRGKNSYTDTLAQRQEFFTQHGWNFNNWLYKYHNERR